MRMTLFHSDFQDHFHKKKDHFHRRKVSSHRAGSHRRAALVWALSFAALFTAADFADDASSETAASVQLLGVSYEGIYDGDQTFTVSEGDVRFVMKGKWRSGEPSGEIVVTYEDGSVLEGTCEDGLLSGLVKQTAADGSLTTFFCDSGIPYGLITSYDPDGNALSYDHYYQTHSVRALVEQAVSVSSEDLSSFEDYSDTPVMLTGTILYVYDTATSEYILLGDDSGAYYFLEFTNHENASVNQAIVPYLTTGDTITAYCYYQNMRSPFSEADNDTDTGGNEAQEVVGELRLYADVLKENGGSPHRSVQEQVSEQLRYEMEENSLNNLFSANSQADGAATSGENTSDDAADSSEAGDSGNHADLADSFSASEDNLDLAATQNASGDGTDTAATQNVSGDGTDTAASRKAQEGSSDSADSQAASGGTAAAGNPAEVDFTGSIFPFFTPYYIVKAEGKNMDRTDLTGSYEEICENGYLYAGQECLVTGSVIQFTESSSGLQLIRIVNDLGEQYCASYDPGTVQILDADGQKSSRTPLSGSRVTVSGRYNGNYKVYEDKTMSGSGLQGQYILYPYLSVDTITYR